MKSLAEESEEPQPESKKIFVLIAFVFLFIIAVIIFLVNIKIEQPGTPIYIFTILRNGVSVPNPEVFPSNNIE